MGRLAFEDFPRAIDDNGDPVSGAKLYVYEKGSTTPVTTYSDAAYAYAVANPIPSDASGYFPQVYIKNAGQYKVRITDNSDVLLFEADFIDQFDTATISEFATVALLVADTTISTDTAAGTIIRAEGFRYEVVTSGEHLTTAGGVKLKALTAADGTYNFAQFGDITSGDAQSVMQTAVNAVTGTIILSDDVTVNSDVVVPSGVKILNVGGSVTQGADNIQCFDFSGTTGCACQGVVFTGFNRTSVNVGSTAKNRAIKADTVVDFVCEFNEISGFANQGIYAESLTGRSRINYNKVTGIGQRNTATDTPYNTGNFVAQMYSPIFIGSHLGTGTTTGLEVIGNEASDALNTLISLTGVKSGVVKRNKVSDGDSNGIQWGTGCGPLVVESNECRDLTGLYDPTTEGWCYSLHADAKYSKVLKNYASGAVRGGINTKGADGCEIVGNYLDDVNSGATAGAILAWGAGVRITGNTVLDSELYCIDASLEEGTIADNFLGYKTSGTAYTAIRQGTTFNASAKNTLISNNSVETDGMLISVTAPYTTVRDHRGAAVYIGGSSDQYILDNALGTYLGAAYSLRAQNSAGTVSVRKKSATSGYSDMTTGTGVLYVMREGVAGRENYGSATVLNGNSSVTVTHDLGVNPAMIVATQKDGTIIDHKVGSVTTTQFNIVTSSAVGADTVFYWYARNSF